MVKFRAKMS